MLNRIYIVVGVIAILVLAGAFIAPRFIQWSDYRDRMEDLASSVLGAEVTIRGDISFSLLPTPRLEFSDVVVGDLEAPAASVAAVEAEFALMDFLRDNYNLTALTLVEPVVDVVLDETGLFTSSVDMAGSGAGVALGQARITDGSLRLTDLRADQVFTVTDVDGDLRMSSFVGPFQFQGSANYGASRYDIRFNSGTVDAGGSTRVTAAIRDMRGAHSVAMDGTLLTGVAPRYDGTLTYRQTPPAVDEADEIRGDLVVESQLDISTDRITISTLTLLPDENRASVRLTGAANIQLGARHEFDAVISGGVFNLPPRDATEVAAELPYEFVRLLSEIPAPPIPPLPGRLGIDLAEVGLRGFGLRELRLDATTDGRTWTIQQAVANMPGDTEVRFSGQVENVSGAVGLIGDVSIDAQRLDALAQLWRRQGEDNPLFNTPGRLDGRLILAGGALGLTSGQFTFAGQTHAVEMRIGFGSEPRLDTVLGIGTLTAAQTTALMALLPNVAAEPSFAVSFPHGSFSLTAGAMDLAGLMATDFVAEGQWSPTDLRFARLAAGDWEGVSFDTVLQLAGDLGDPRVTGLGEVTVRAADAGGLAALYDLTGVPPNWQEGLAANWPAELEFELVDNAEDSGQVLTIGGELGAGDFDLRAEMGGGLTAIADDDVVLIGSIEAADDLTLQEQLGLGRAPLLTGDGPIAGSLFLEGSASRGFEGRIGLSQGGSALNYSGRITFTDSGEVSGDGSLDAILETTSGLAALAGLEDAGLPAIDANARLQFDGRRTLSLENISGVSGNTAFTGEISMQSLGQLPNYSGTIAVESADIVSLGAAFLGAQALGVPGADIWPEGPLAVATAARPSRGNIAVTADTVTAAGLPVFGETGFTYGWDPQAVRIEDLQAQAGTGTVGLTMALCCAGPLSERTLSGRLSLAGVAIDDILPPGAAAGLEGAVTGGVQFEGTGQSLAEVMRSLVGEGNFNIAAFEATGLAASVFPTISAIEDPLTAEPDALETLIGLGLGQGDFTAPEARGAFSIAGGTARLGNLIVEGDGALLSGGLDLALSTLGLNGNFVLTPRDYVDPTGLVQADTARIIARIAGSLLAPSITIDLGEMVAAIQVRANEIEVERLETLRLEDEARQRAAAEERNRLIEEQRRAAEEAAAQRAAEEALEQEASPPPAPAPGTPLDLGFDPPVNQPVGPAVNQPLQPLPGN